MTAARVDLDRALDALVENALQYSPPGSSVEIEVRPGRLQVLDAGPGLAPGEGEQIFDRFHRGAAGRSGPAGTGLGLPIARELMGRWDARVWLENRPGSGARAVIAFGYSAEGSAAMRRVSRSTLAWVALALAGLVVAVMVSFAASRLSKPTVGLASEPVSGVTELAPKPRRPTSTSPRPKPQPPSTRGHHPAPAVTAVPSDDEWRR